MVDTPARATVYWRRQAAAIVRPLIVMRYDILRHIQAGRQVRCHLAGPGPEGTGLKLVGPLRGEILIIPTGAGAVARGTIEVDYETQCARCLKPLRRTLKIQIDRECSLKQIDDPASYHPDEGPDITPVPILSGEIVDLSELIREAIVINAPVRELCSEDCKGICPRCGANLNEGECQCEEDQVDPRLAPLRKLLEEKAGE